MSAAEAVEPQASTVAEKKGAPVEALFAAPAGKADDLKKITGVGPALERKLNALGVKQYAQIAALSDEDVEKVDTALNYKGRIGRDDWVGQAKALSEGVDA